MIPDQLNYSVVRPRGWYTKFRQWPIYPASSNQYWASNEIIRFLFQMTNGVMDPYRSHIQTTVQVFAADLPVGGLVMDVSAQSLFAQCVVSSNGREVQRISSYDTLAAYLYDIGFNQWVCQNRQWQGMGFDQQNTAKRVQTSPYSSNQVYMVTAANAIANQRVIVQSAVAGCFSPTKTVSTIPNGGSTFGISTVQPTNPPFQYSGFGFAGGNLPQHVSSSNKTWNDFSVTGITDSLQTSGKQNNIRFQYQPQTSIRSPYIDSSTSYVTNNPLLPIGVIPSTWNSGNTMPSNMTYSTYYSTTNAQRLYYNDGTTVNAKNVTPPNTCNLYGYSKPYSAAFSRGMNQPMLSPTIPQCQMSYGRILSAPVPITTKVFRNILLSGVIGGLIPANQFALLPLASLNNTLIEITLNPYAMYSTGYKDVHQLDSTGMQQQIPRKYYVSKMVYVLHIYQFPQPQMLQHINDSLTKQIVLGSQSWTLGSQYQIPTGSMVKNNWSVNVACQWLAQVVCLFVSNEYMKYTFCRKHFRLSNCITSFQLKFNVDYMPPQPIVGNAGNPQYLDTTGDNSAFLKQILMSNGFLFNTNVPQPKINPFNFALNGRIYNPANQNPLYELAMYRAPSTYVWSQNSVNGDTALGQSYFHQNRHRGMAAFTYSFQPHGHSKQYMIGVDTRNARPFQVIFDTATAGEYTKDQTLYIFCRLHVVVTYGSQGIMVYGR